MPWKECTWMSERQEFIRRVGSSVATVSALSRAFSISRKTAYKWLGRYEKQGEAGLADRSRRPLRSPRRSSPAMEAAVCELRQAHPVWGGRKIHHVLRRQGLASVPAPSTITGILERNGLLLPDRRLQRDLLRFEAERPNELWQMDFKGHFPTLAGRCNPLTILDDHSRFNVCLAACPDQRAETVQTELTHAFRRYGLPERMLMDNGSPWGSEKAHPHTWLTAWLMRLGVSVSHGRPYHPQTQGKEERFHRTLKEEVLCPHSDWLDLREAQLAFDAWRDIYNFERPHQAIGDDFPASRYRQSPRPFPAKLPAIEYERGDEVRKVQDKGRISFRGQSFLISRAFVGERVALRPAGEGVWDVYYCCQRVAKVDLVHQPQVSPV